MEMTKKRITSAQPIATIFRQQLMRRPEAAEPRVSTVICARIPTMATQTQTRLSVSSMKFDYSMDA